MAKTTRKKSGRVRHWRTAANSDRHELYELSVQGTESDCAFIDRVFRQRQHRTPHSLREDFCGTGLLAREWVSWRNTNTAVGIDLDPAVLRKGRERIASLPLAARTRIQLKKGDVNKVRTDPADVLVALNFSYFIFRTRAQLLEFFIHARQGVAAGGMIVIDAYGGSGSWSIGEEERSLDGFTYVWHQARVSPITHEVTNHIHFRFPDGSEMRRAFTYVWRLWTLAEIKELLIEAGFHAPVVYWEGTDRKSGEGNGVFKPSRSGEACEGWIVYIVAEN
ncbi:MAG: class I SAM-dependent methyltransferase [Phycisphaerales bacterium]|nr:class I SAM-dependent methyltransferase [Phycisphaerales bacterium]